MYHNGLYSFVNPNPGNVLNDVYDIKYKCQVHLF